MRPVPNMEEAIPKTVGRRRIKDSLEYALGLQRSLATMQPPSAVPRFPRGVFKFRSFEEAEAWTMRYLTTPKS